MYLKCASWPEISDVEFNLHSILGVDVLGVCEVFYVYYVWVVQ